MSTPARTHHLNHALHDVQNLRALAKVSTVPNKCPQDYRNYVVCHILGAFYCVRNMSEEVNNVSGLNWYYDQKIISFFPSNFESIFALHLTSKILSFAFYPKAVYFECKFWN